MKKLYHVTLESSFQLYILVEAENPEQALEIAHDTNDYDQVHLGLELIDTKEVSREEAKLIVSESNAPWLVNTDEAFERIIGRKE